MEENWVGRSLIGLAAGWLALVRKRRWPLPFNPLLYEEGKEVGFPSEFHGPPPPLAEFTSVSRTPPRLLPSDRCRTIHFLVVALLDCRSIGVVVVGDRIDRLPVHMWTLHLLLCFLLLLVLVAVDRDTRE